jgi:hypothetical protein
MSVFIIGEIAGVYASSNPVETCGELAANGTKVTENRAPHPYDHLDDGRATISCFRSRCKYQLLQTQQHPHPFSLPNTSANQLPLNPDSQPCIQPVNDWLARLFDLKTI